jgi:hypothetical protein
MPVQQTLRNGRARFVVFIIRLLVAWREPLDGAICSGDDIVRGWDEGN